jgi:ADP-ribosylglycohydrolase
MQIEQGYSEQPGHDADYPQRADCGKNRSKVTDDTRLVLISQVQLSIPLNEKMSGRHAALKQFNAHF